MVPSAQGATPRSATLTACRLRLRPILMTSLAFILGVLPLVVARGAGAEMRWSLGVTVFAGMIGVTLFGILITPVCYYLLESLSTRLGAAPAAATNRSGRPPALNSP